jgi:plastocyanin
MTATVHLTSSGFSPKSVTVAKGGTVTFINDTTGNMWVASAQHPTHTVYDGTDRAAHCTAGYTGAKPFDQCANGNTYNFAFNKVGSINYHNHSNSSQFGTVVVQ